MIREVGQVLFHWTPESLHDVFKVTSVGGIRARIHIQCLN